METIDTPLYYKHLGKGEVIPIGDLACEKVGVQASERITSHHHDMISRIIKDFADHAILGQRGHGAENPLETMGWIRPLLFDMKTIILLASIL